MDNGQCGRNGPWAQGPHHWQCTVVAVSTHDNQDLQAHGHNHALWHPGWAQLCKLEMTRICIHAIHGNNATHACLQVVLGARCTTGTCGVRTCNATCRCSGKATAVNHICSCARRTQTVFAYTMYRAYSPSKLNARHTPCPTPADTERLPSLNRLCAHREAGRQAGGAICMQGTCCRSDTSESNACTIMMPEWQRKWHFAGSTNA